MMNLEWRNVIPFNENRRHQVGWNVVGVVPCGQRLKRAASTGMRPK